MDKRDASMQLGVQVKLHASKHLSTALILNGEITGNNKSIYGNVINSLHTHGKCGALKTE